VRVPSESQVLIARIPFQSSNGLLNASDAVVRSLIAIRDNTSIEVCEHTDQLWLRFSSTSATDWVGQLRRLPDCELFHLDSQNRLTPKGYFVPTALLPDSIVWCPIKDWVRLWLPNTIATDPFRRGDLQSSLPSLKWCTSAYEIAPGGLLCRFNDWSEFVLKNFQQRVSSLKFAYRRATLSSQTGDDHCSSMDTLIVGEHLPSIPGIRLTCQDRILMPIPFTWSPTVPALIVRRALGMAEGEWLLWSAERVLERIPDHAFVPATRLNLAATAEQTTA
jgi:hypothetical protein